MQIPHKVLVKPGISYFVAYVDKFDDKDQLGYCLDKNSDMGSRTILLKLGMSETLTAKIFIHEVFHAIEFEYNIKIPHQLIRDLEEPMFYLFTRNPKAFVSSFSGAKRSNKKRKK